MAAAHPSDDGEALLDWNESPIGPPPLAVKRVLDAVERLHRYPRGLLEEVTELAAGHFGVRTDEVLLTAGVDEAVDMTLSLAVRAWGLRPGFDGYPDRAAANGKPYHAIPLNANWRPVEVLPGQLGAADIVYLAQPGNPTGDLLAGAWIQEVRQAAGYVFIDETYQDFSTWPGILTRVGGPRPGLLVYRSFSKAAGLAGIRLGCLIADSGTISRLEPLRRFMPIDAVSLNAGAGLLADPTFMVRLVEYVREARSELHEMLRASGLFAEVRGSETNFVLARPAEATRAGVAATLAQDHVRVKDCAAVGLPGWLRISVGSPADQLRLRRSLTRARSLAQLAQP